MKPGMKMMMMEHIRQQPENNRSEYSGDNRRLIGFDRDRNGQARTSNYGDMEYGGGTSNYSENNRYGMEETENRRRRDSRGRYMEGEGWEGNRDYAEPEARRRRDRRGRYMMDEEDDAEMRSQTWYPPQSAMPYVPPMNHVPAVTVPPAAVPPATIPQMPAPATAIPPMGVPPMAVLPTAVPPTAAPHTGLHPGNSYGDIYAHGTMYALGAMNKPMGQGGSNEQYGEMDEHTARKWVRKMHNADGTPSPHWQPEQVEPLRMQYCPDCSKWEFWACMNMLYADYGAVAKKMGVDKPEYYACMAKAFLEDEDAKDNKLMRYMKVVSE